MEKVLSVGFLLVRKMLKTQEPGKWGKGNTLTMQFVP